MSRSLSPIAILASFPFCNIFSNTTALCSTHISFVTSTNFWNSLQHFHIHSSFLSILYYIDLISRTKSYLQSSTSQTCANISKRIHSSIENLRLDWDKTLVVVGRSSQVSTASNRCHACRSSIACQFLVIPFALPCANLHTKLQHPPTGLPAAVF
jgi:hypothetical protein